MRQCLILGQELGWSKRQMEVACQRCVGQNSVKQNLQRFCSRSQGSNVRGASSEGDCAQGLCVSSM